VTLLCDLSGAHSGVGAGVCSRGRTSRDEQAMGFSQRDGNNDRGRGWMANTADRRQRSTSSRGPVTGFRDHVGDLYLDGNRGFRGGGGAGRNSATGNDSGPSKGVSRNFPLESWSTGLKNHFPYETSNKRVVSPDLIIALQGLRPCTLLPDIENSSSTRRSDQKHYPFSASLISLHFLKMVARDVVD
jgi:hypothetical protein